MIPFHTVCPEVAAREIRSVKVAAGHRLPPGEYGFVEWYCEDVNCDCRRVLIEVRPRAQPDQPAAFIAWGWEPQAYYVKQSSMPRDLARDMARETTEGSLDPINPQSPQAPALLEVFRDMVSADYEYVTRLKRHYELLRQTLKQKGRA